jgi:hypothetical protein
MTSILFVQWYVTTTETGQPIEARRYFADPIARKPAIDAVVRGLVVKHSATRSWQEKADELRNITTASSNSHDGHNTSGATLFTLTVPRNVMDALAPGLADEVVTLIAGLPDAVKLCNKHGYSRQ